MLIIVALFIKLANLKHLIYEKILLVKMVDMYKKYWLNFQSIQNCFITLFLFSIYKMIDSMDIYKSLNINIATAMKI